MIREVEYDVEHVVLSRVCSTEPVLHVTVWRRVVEHHPDGTTVIGPRQIETMFTHQHKDDQ